MTNMRDLRTVIAFSIKDMVKRKSFIISTLIILVLIVIGFNIPNIISMFTDETESSGETKLLIVDTTNLFEGTLPSLNYMELGYNVQVANNDVSFEDIKSRIENNDINEAMIIEQKEDGTYTLRYIVENMTQVASVPEDLINAMNTLYTILQISKLGLTQEQIAEKLGVSINAVSKWERGLCLMDMSLLKPLSQILDVTINEILSGEEIKTEDIINKADENIVNLTELYDLKSSKIGVDVFTVVTLVLFIYYGKKEMNCLGFAMIWLVYRMTYSYNKYKYTKDKQTKINEATLNAHPIIPQKVNLYFFLFSFSSIL